MISKISRSLKGVRGVGVQCQVGTKRLESKRAFKMEIHTNRCIQ